METMWTSCRGMVETVWARRWACGRRVVAATAALVLLGGAPYPAVECTGAGESAGEMRSDVADPEYVIGPTDVLEIEVWKEPGLSKTVPVRPDGKITLPLMDDVEAAGLTPLELKARLEAALAKYVEHPTVSVAVQEINSKNVYIVGKVNAPGQYPLERGLTVMQALSLAGGFEEWADPGDIVILRRENGKEIRLKFNYGRVSKGKDLETNILLRPGDTIIVP